MVGYLVAAAVAAMLSDLAFEPSDTAFWRRWLGRWRYWTHRVLLGLVPALGGLVPALSMPMGSSVGDQMLRGTLAGVTAAAMLRADLGRTHLRRADGKGSGTARATSALAWAYGRMCLRLDAQAAQRIHAELGRQKVAVPECRELLSTGEEVAVVLSQEALAGRTRGEREAAQERLAQLRTNLDVVDDPLATPAQRQGGAFAVAEILAGEFVIRRWGRDSAPVRVKGDQ